MRGGDSIFLYMGYCAVGAFFFVSGYGTMYSCLESDNSDQGGASFRKKILYRKIPSLVLMCLLTIGLDALFWFFYGEPVSIREVLLAFTGNRLLNWFFGFLILKYILFVVLDKFLHNKKPEKLLIAYFVVICAYMIVAKAVELQTSRYYSALCFPLGMLVCNISRTNFGKNFCGLQKRYLCFGFGALFILVYGFCYMTVDLNLVTLLAKLGCYVLATTLFALFLFVFVRGTQSRGILTWIGNRSAEIILLQTVSLELYQSKWIYVQNDYLYAALVVVTNLVLAWVMSHVYKWISNKVIWVGK